MRRLIVLVLMLVASVSCKKYEEYPLRPVSFEIGDTFYYSAKDVSNVGGILAPYPEARTMHVLSYGDSLDIDYSRSTDFLNYDMETLGIALKGVRAVFETGIRIDFSLPDSIPAFGVWQYVPYVMLAPIKSSSASDRDVYFATEGWIEFDNIDISVRTVSGRFEFKAALKDDDECDHADTIEVRNGTFRNIPFELTIYR